MNVEFIVAIAVQTILFLAGGYSMVLRNDWSNKSMAEKMAGMQAELEKLSQVITTQAVQTMRLDNVVEQVTMLQRTVEELRRGDGWIGRRSVDGEYP